MDDFKRFCVQHPVSRERPFKAESTESVQVDPSLELLVSDWRRVTERNIGTNLPLGIMNRRSIAESADTPGEVNYQYPMCVNAQWFLVIVLEDVYSPDPAIIGHEVMHWMLLDEGFRHVKPSHPLNRTQATQSLNDLSHHVPLNSRMAAYGIDYASLQEVVTQGIMDRMRDGRFMKQEPNREELWHFSFVAADLLLNCTSAIRPLLDSELDSYSRIKSQTDAVLNTLQEFDLLDPNANQEAQSKLISTLGMPEHVHVNNFDTLKQRIGQ